MTKAYNEMNTYIIGAYGSIKNYLKANTTQTTWLKIWALGALTLLITCIAINLISLIALKYIGLLPINFNEMFILIAGSLIVGLSVWTISSIAIINNNRSTYRLSISASEKQIKNEIQLLIYNNLDINIDLKNQGDDLLSEIFDLKAINTEFDASYAKHGEIPNVFESNISEYIQSFSNKNNNKVLEAFAAFDHNAFNVNNLKLRTPLYKTLVKLHYLAWCVKNKNDTSIKFDSFFQHNIANQLTQEKHSEILNDRPDFVHNIKTKWLGTTEDSVIGSAGGFILKSHFRYKATLIFSSIMPCLLLFSNNLIKSCNDIPLHELNIILVQNVIIFLTILIAFAAISFLIQDLLLSLCREDALEVFDSMIYNKDLIHGVDTRFNNFLSSDGVSYSQKATLFDNSKDDESKNGFGLIELTMAAINGIKPMMYAN